MIPAAKRKEIIGYRVRMDLPLHYARDVMQYFRKAGPR